MLSPTPAIKSQVIQRIIKAPIAKVWTPVDFLDLGSRDAVDKALQRMLTSNDLRCIDRGLYDQTSANSLTGLPAAPVCRSVINAVGRRDQVRVLINGMTAANDLGLTNAVPGQVIVHTDGRLCSSVGSVARFTAFIGRVQRHRFSGGRLTSSSLPLR